MAILHIHKGELPDARTRLYEEVIDLLLMNWEKTKVLDRSGQEIAFRQLLETAKLQEIDFKRALWQIAFDVHGQIQTRESKYSTANIAETTLIKTFKKLHPQDDWNWAAQMTSVIKHRAGLLVEVGIFLKGNTAEGVSDMAGNVWEWTATILEDGKHAMCGGAWNDTGIIARCTLRIYLRPDERRHYVGFRCVRT
jgi:hypothetical protein